MANLAVANAKGGIMEYCTKCNQDTEFRKGVSKKNGKEWQGFKCLNPECGNMDFIKDTDTAHKVVKEVGIPVKKNGDAFTEGKKENTRLMKRCDLMCELVKKHDVTTVTQAIKDMFNDLWSEVEK